MGKQTYIRIFFGLCIMMIMAGPLSARTAYVSSITQVTLRTEPGVDHRIVEMLKSGTALEIVEYRKDWSKVRTSSGNQGWILTRFITEEKPRILIVDELTKSNRDLSARIDSLEAENRELKDENARLTVVEQEYNVLKNESEQFFELKEKYEQIKQDYDRQVKIIQSLEENLASDDKIFFLCGAGVFLVGLILGVSARKKKKSSLL